MKSGNHFFVCRPSRNSFEVSFLIPPVVRGGFGLGPQFLVFEGDVGLAFRQDLLGFCYVQVTLGQLAFLFGIPTEIHPFPIYHRGHGVIFQVVPFPLPEYFHRTGVIDFRSRHGGIACSVAEQAVGGPCAVVADHSGPTGNLDTRIVDRVLWRFLLERGRSRSRSLWDRRLNLLGVPLPGSARGLAGIPFPGSAGQISRWARRVHFLRGRGADTAKDSKIIPKLWNFLSPLSGSADRSAWIPSPGRPGGKTGLTPWVLPHPRHDVSHLQIEQIGQIHVSPLPGGLAVSRTRLQHPALLSSG